MSPPATSKFFTPFPAPSHSGAEVAVCPRPPLPAAAFIDPRGGNRDHVAALLHRAADLVCDLAATAAEREPLSLHAELPVAVEIPETGADEAEIMAELRELLAGSMNPAHPGYAGHMDSLPATMSIVGDLGAAAANNNLLSVELSPVFSRLESGLMQAMAERFGLGTEDLEMLPRGASTPGGLMTAGGTLANLHALAVARNLRFTVPEPRRPVRPVVLASEAAHTSFHKAAMLLGLGDDGIVEVATDADGRMDPADLARRIAAVREAGATPFCVVAIAGTTVTGNIDPLPQIAAVAREQDLWLHVDAAYGGALVFSPEERVRLDGIERADSVTFNPQKWMYVTKTCAMVLFRDTAMAERVFRIRKPYFSAPEGEINAGEIGVQGTRHADVLKLWLTLRHLGASGFARLIADSYRLTRAFVAEIEKRPFLRLATRPETNIVCFRGEPDWVPEEEHDEWNTRLRAALLDARRFYLSLPVFRQRRWLRAVLLNPYTDEATVEAAFAGVDAFAAESRAGRTSGV